MALNAGEAIEETLLGFGVVDVNMAVVLGGVMALGPGRAG